MTGYFVVRNVEVEVNGGNRSVGIELFGDDHARLEDVRIVGEGRAVDLVGTDLSTDGVEVATTTTECWEAHESTLRLERVRIRGMCGAVAILTTKSRLVARDVRLSKVANGIQVQDPSSRIELENVTVTATNRSVHAAQRELAVASRGVWLNGTDGQRFGVEDVTVRGFRSCLDVSGALPSGLHLASIRLENCGEHRGHAGLTVANDGENPIQVEDLEVSNATVGLEATRRTVHVRDSRIANSDVGLLAQQREPAGDPPKIRASNVAFEGNGITAKAVPPGTIQLVDPAGEAPSLQGPVEVSPATTRDTGHASGWLGTLALVGALAGVRARVRG